MPKLRPTKLNREALVAHARFIAERAQWLAELAPRLDGHIPRAEQDDIAAEIEAVWDAMGGSVGAATKRLSEIVDQEHALTRVSGVRAALAREMLGMQLHDGDQGLLRSRKTAYYYEARKQVDGCLAAMAQDVPQSRRGRPLALATADGARIKFGGPLRPAVRLQRWATGQIAYDETTAADKVRDRFLREYPEYREPAMSCNLNVVVVAVRNAGRGRRNASQHYVRAANNDRPKDAALGELCAAFGLGRRATQTIADRKRKPKPPRKAAAKVRR